MSSVSSDVTRITMLELEIENEIDRLATEVPYAHLTTASDSIKVKLKQLEHLTADLAHSSDPSLQKANLLLRSQNNHERVLAHLRTSHRKALLSLKSKQASQERKERAQLFSTPGARLTSSTSNANVKTTEKSRDFTKALSRTRALLATEVKKSAEALGALESSAAQISETKTGYDKFGQKLKSGSSLVSKLSRRGTTDKILTVVAAFFFLLTVLYVLKRRATNVLGVFDIFGWMGSSDISHAEL